MIPVIDEHFFSQSLLGKTMNADIEYVKIILI